MISKIAKGEVGRNLVGKFIVLWVKEGKGHKAVLAKRAVEVLGLNEPNLIHYRYLDGTKKGKKFHGIIEPKHSLDVCDTAEEALKEASKERHG